MPKALICGSHGQTATSGQEWVLGGIFRAATEAQSQAQATETATFTGLRGSILSGGSGTNTFQFRNAGANGNNVASLVGVGAFEDTTPHSDTVAAGALFNGAYTDTGTDSVTGPVAMNVAFASGHGNFHFCSAAANVVCDVPSATRYLPIHGAPAADGVAAASIAIVQFKNYEYTSIEAFQIRINANARLNNSVFSVNINGVDVGTAITFATLVTGLQVVVEPHVLAVGDLVCVSMTLGTGVEDLNFGFLGVTLKSTQNISASGYASSNGTTRAASATPNYYSYGNNTDTVEANCAVRVGFRTRVRDLRIYVAANTYSVDATLKLFVGGAPKMTTTITAGAANQWLANTTDSYDIIDTDLVSYEIVGGSAGSITFHQIFNGFFPPMHQAGLQPDDEGISGRWGLSSIEEGQM